MYAFPPCGKVRRNINTFKLTSHMKQKPISVYHDRYVEFGVFIAVVCKQHHIITRQLQELTGLHPRHLSSAKKR